LPLALRNFTECIFSTSIGVTGQWRIRRWQTKLNELNVVTIGADYNAARGWIGLDCATVVAVYVSLERIAKKEVANDADVSPDRVRDVAVNPTV
jgi:hypothetical protein